MSDIIRAARQMYGPLFDEMAADAGQIKEEYVQQGGDPSHVFSPERMDALAAGGPGALEDEPPSVRPDGSIAAPYLPPEMALGAGLIEPAAQPSVLAGLMDGVHTVSSGFDPKIGRGYAIGRNLDGQVVRYENTPQGEVLR